MQSWVSGGGGVGGDSVTSGAGSTARCAAGGRAVVVVVCAAAGCSGPTVAWPAATATAERRHHQHRREMNNRELTLPPWSRPLRCSQQIHIPASPPARVLGLSPGDDGVCLCCRCRAFFGPVRGGPAAVARCAGKRGNVSVIWGKGIRLSLLISLFLASVGELRKSLSDG